MPVILHPLAQFLFFISSVLEVIKKKKAAYKVCRMALVFSDNNYTILCRLSRLAREVGYPRIAHYFADRAVGLVPEMNEAVYELGYCQYDLKDYIQSECIFSYLRNTNANNYLSSYWLGKVRLQQGNFAGAYSELSRGRQLCFWDIALLQDLASCCVQMGCVADAANHLRRAHALAPENHEIRDQLHKVCELSY